jgi:hypothetical protein
MKKAINTERLDPLIVRIRGHRVVLDVDLARLYGVPTFRFNEAFKRNRHRFPADFAFQLTREEFTNLRSQFAISSSQAADAIANKGMWSQFATTSHGGRRHVPWVFTQHGAVMAANILRSERLAEIDKTLLEHDTALRDLYRKLLPLLEPPADPPARPIGFHTDLD